MVKLLRDFIRLNKLSLLFCLLTSFLLLSFNIVNIYQSLIKLFIVKIIFIIIFKIIFNALFTFFWLNIFSIFIKKRITLYYSVFIFCTLLSIINYFKVIYLASPLAASDIFLISETWKVIDSSQKAAIISLLFLILIIGYFLSAKSAKRSKTNFKIFSANIFFLIGVWILQMFIEDNISYCQEINLIKPFCSLSLNARAKPDWHGDLVTVNENGFIPFFTYKLGEKVLNNITKEHISKLEVENLLNTHYSSKISSKIKNPNIVVIVEESFSDPRLYDSNLPSEDFTFIDNYKKTNFMSPVFGGGTANAEFEILTGLNISFYPDELMFVSKIKKPTYSLAYALKNHGYKTIAIHNFPKSFYNRQTIYPLLGFDEFYSLENLSTKILNADFTKDEITNDLVYSKILNLITQTQEPTFIYALTVKNHGQYEDNRYGPSSYNFSLPLTTKDKQAFGTYALGIKLTNIQLNNLVTQLKQLKRPTLLVVLGDHHPFIKNVSELNEKNTKQLENYYTPLMFWDNFHANYSKINNKNFISAPFLSNEILNIANLPSSNYFDLINKVSNCFEAIHKEFVIKNSQCTDENKKLLLSKYTKLNEDVLSGENYTFEIAK